MCFSKARNGSARPPERPQSPPPSSQTSPVQICNLLVDGSRATRKSMRRKLGISAKSDMIQFKSLFESWRVSSKTLLKSSLLPLKSSARASDSEKVLNDLCPKTGETKRISMMLPCLRNTDGSQRSPWMRFWTKTSPRGSRPGSLTTNSCNFLASSSWSLAATTSSEFQEKPNLAMKPAHEDSPRTEAALSAAILAHFVISATDMRHVGGI
mmetsp:Transcript_8703/g.15417  ORF Transcript_8703/g.15417 Transcript_8703/m.15417 type:complete len:211 (-) Transcript_8703:12-644(-)